jgi:molybdenum cofactor synthesis domain-containing protein
VKAAVVTVSDRSHQGLRDDLAGPRLVELLTRTGFEVESPTVVPDDRLAIVRELLRLADEARVNLVLTTGGTGAAPRDVTPEATRMILERPFPGIAEALRTESAKHTKFAMLSRGTAGTRGATLIINLPGNPGAVDQLWPVLDPIVGHVCRLLTGTDDPHE